MLLALLLLAIIGLFTQLIVLIFVLERTGPLLVMHERLIHVENYVEELSEAISQQMMNTGPSAVFRSMDGKYSANSLEELAQRMIEGENIHNAEGLKKLFNDLAQDEDDSEDEDEDDEGGQ